LAVQVAAVSFFGVFFSLGFFLVYLGTLVEVWIARDKFFTLKRRPSTTGESSLASFNGIFYAIFLISVMTLLFIQTYLTYSYYRDQTIVNGVFILTFVGGLIFILLLRILGFKLDWVG
jgi:protein-S-isoprenylcysteine O-methyltransferase Ste14